MKKRIPIYSVLVLFAAVLLTFGCASPQKNIDEGNYEAAIEATLNRLSGKKKKKTELVLALEEAYNKVTLRDMELADRLKRDNRAENWPRIYKLYNTISRRQQKLDPFLPIVSNEGVQAEFKFVRIEGLEREAKENTAAYFYEESQRLLSDARNGDRLAAREAFGLLSNIDALYRNYEQKDYMKQTALELGTTFVHVDLVNRAPVILPLGFKEALLELSGERLDNEWREVHTRKMVGVEYDYKVVINLADIAVSPSRTNERTYEESATIEVESDRTSNRVSGSEKQDTTRREAPQSEQIEVVATVTEVHQTKAATLTGVVEFIDLRTGQMVDREEVTADAFFENFAATFNGDKRALSEATLNRIGNRPVRFPTDAELLMEAAAELRPVISRRIRNNRRVI